MYVSHANDERKAQHIKKPWSIKLRPQKQKGILKQSYMNFDVLKAKKLCVQANSVVCPCKLLGAFIQIPLCIHANSVVLPCKLCCASLQVVFCVHANKWQRQKKNPCDNCFIGLSIFFNESKKKF